MARGRHPTRIRIDPPGEQAAAKYLRVWRGCDLHADPRRFPCLTSQDMFGNARPMEIDLGCGNGVLAVGRAEKFADVNYLGIDRSQKPLFDAVRRAEALDLDNVMFIRGDFYAMQALLRPNTIRTVFYLFPNPPRDYHVTRANAHRRTFLRILHDALIPGGIFYFATDSNAFFGCMEGILKNDLRYAPRRTEIVDSDMGTGYRRIWEERGRDVNGLSVEKEPE